MLLDDLLSLLSLGWLLEGLGGDGTLKGLELEGVSGWEEMGVVDNLDERLDLRPPGNSLLTHGLGHLERVPGWIEGHVRDCFALEQFVPSTPSNLS